MRQLYETENGCSLHILYLEGGFVPAQYVIMGNIANFIHYILQERTDSFLMKMLEAQIEHPVKHYLNSEAKLF